MTQTKRVTKDTVQVLREGFWKAENNPATQMLPTPTPRKKKWIGRKKFLHELKSVMKHDKVQVIHYKGRSKCRCCGINTGSAENKLHLFGVTWVWPVGYLHYVEEHNIRPSLAFQEFIAMSYELFYTE